MHPGVAETIFDIVKILPKTKQKKVLDFVTDLRDESGASLQNLLQNIEKQGKEIPDEVWKKIPTDGSINHDHYLYGAKKRK